LKPEKMTQTKADLPSCRGYRAVLHAFVLAVFYSLVWLALTGGDPLSWIVGAPAVLLAVTVSLFLSPGCMRTVSFGHALLFLPYFIVQSILSGLDVLRRTFSPKLRINPGLFIYRTSLPEESSRVLLANIISLLPGTISTDLQDEEIIIHVLDTGLPARENIRQLEIRIARIFHQPAAGGEKA
jgi:multicomponent Na+:H+ antiporter subunit E